MKPEVRKIIVIALVAAITAVVAEHYLRPALTKALP